MHGSVLLGHLPAALGLCVRTTLILPFLPKGLHIGMSGCPLGFYLAELHPSLISRQEEKQPGPNLPVSGGAGTVTMEAQERPGFQEAFLEGPLRSRVSMADVTPSHLLELGVRCSLLKQGILIYRLSAFDFASFTIR